ncbi:unnamed protein product [Zymoseptoria tritici ST99CH_1A5]|nr:unnamed protein product [Zymoseptoria tritici ST99CH_3D1]SMY25035.1 unnamed protein product [Zymoseptoria tritici ST99CH_1A5]
MKHEAPPMPEMDNNPMPDMNNADSMNVFWSSLSSGDESYVNTASWGDAATQLSYAHHDHSGMNCIPESMQYSLSQPVPGMQRSDSYSTFGSMPDMSHGSFQSRSIPSSTAATTDNDVSFDTTMQLCKDLHEYRSHVSRRPSFSPSVHHNLFHDMLRMCTAATNMPPQNTSGPACPATALVLAAMLQFLDVCGLIISRLSDSSSMSTPASTHLENMFLLRKMDLVLLPTKLFLSDKGHHAGVARAQALHHEIEAVISNEYPQLAWGDGQGMLTAGQGEMFQQQM